MPNFYFFYYIKQVQKTDLKTDFKYFRKKFYISQNFPYEIYFSNKARKGNYCH